ncbi:hypothetical protein [Nocardia sp. CA-135398]|uniref:hypothetical protein n=1 Tax=Nocardia sp. CA-135398 TaxID=3239977 RepID=UPI003D9672B8
MAVVWAAFDRFAVQPLPADPRPVPSPAGSPVESWDGLRELLWDPALPIEQVDAIWVWLIERARVHSGDATLVCASLAVPMLAGMARLFAAPGTRHRHDVESEVLTGFLTHLECVELDRPVLWYRLRWAVYRAAIRAAQQQDTETEPVADLALALDLLGARARVILPQPGHPETVLAEAVAAGVITAGAAELIVVSRWERRSLASLAAERGHSHWKLHKQRERAEARLLAWLAERVLDAADTSTTETHALNGPPPSHRGRPAESGRGEGGQNSLAPVDPCIGGQEVRSCA